MNPFVTSKPRFVRPRMAALTAMVLSLALVPAFAATKEKVKKPKKNVDLSANPLANVNSRQPDKELYDKALVALKKGRFDVARLDLQTLLNTYPESEYQMRAKLAIGDAWFKEGGTAALTQAENEYSDFITFFPQAPEAAEAQMKVGDIYYMQMEKPDRDFNNAERAEQEYRKMINMFPDSQLVPRAKQKLREVQEVLAEREFIIGAYYGSRMNWSGSLARLETVADTYPLYSKSDQLWLQIGDDYAGEAHNVKLARNLPSAVRERLSAIYEDKAAAAYGHVVSRYPMAPHVEDARDRLIAMNRPVPEPTQQALTESEAEEQSRQPVRFTDKTLGMIKHGPTVVEAAHVGDPTMTAPQRTLAPQISKENQQIFAAAFKGVQPGAATTTSQAQTPTGVHEPPRSDQPQAPLTFQDVPAGAGSGAGGNSIGASIVSAPNSAPAATSSGDSAQPAQGAAADPNAVIKPVVNANTTLPAAEAPAEAPAQINDIRPGSQPAQSTAPTTADGKKAKKPALDQSEESSSKKKKKKGLSKLNPF